MALDEPKETDETQGHDGLTFLIDRELLKNLEGVKVDYLEQGWRSGFVVSSTRPLNPSPVSCESSCCG